MDRILIVEDDAIIASHIAESLTRWGYEARCVSDFADVTGEFERFAPQLVLMDLSLPFFNGFYWCAELRKRSKAPIVFLSSRADSMDIVMAVNMGGDDYLAKPVSMEVLVAKVQAMLRRAYAYEAQPAFTLRGARLDAAGLCLVRGESRVPLTRNEARILQLLLQNKAQIVSREQLMLALWDSDAFIDDNTLTVNVNRLRKTLEGAGLIGCIVTHKNQGYAVHE